MSRRHRYTNPHNGEDNNSDVLLSPGVPRFQFGLISEGILKTLRHGNKNRNRNYFNNER